MTITCPKCSETFECLAYAVIPHSQVLYMKLTSENELFAAEVIGQAILDISKLQIAVSEGIGIKVSVFLKSVLIEPYQVTIGFQIAQTKR